MNIVVKTANMIILKTLEFVCAFFGSATKQRLSKVKAKLNA